MQEYGKNMSEIKFLKSRILDTLQMSIFRNYLRGRHMKTITKAACLILCVSSANTFAAGFATDVPSAAAMGNSYAGQVTGTHNIGNMFVNPAVLTEFSGHQINVDGNYIAPSIKVKGGATAKNAPAFGGSDIDITGDGSKGIHGDENSFVPMFYSMYDLFENTKLGLSITVPFGLATSYRDNWIGRYHALDSEIKTLNINPIIAYKINDYVSVAGGPQFQYIDAMLSSAIDFGTLTALTGGPGVPTLSFDGETEVTGDDWGYGYKLGILVKPNENTKIGLSYRSKIEHTLEGENDFTLPSNVPTATLAAATGRFVDTDAKVKITTPETVNIGIAHLFSPKIQVMADAAWTRWSRLNTLEIEHKNPSEPTDVTNLKWDDSWMYSLGLNYFVNEKWTVRSGVAYEETAIPSQYFTPRLPIPDKYLVSVGFSYNVSDKVTIDASYVHEFFDDAKTRLDFSDPNNTFRGDLNTEYDVNLSAAAVSMNYRF